jgi:hypothetical protein
MANTQPSAYCAPGAPNRTAMNSDHFWLQLELAKRQREAGDVIAAANTLLAAYDVLLSHYDEAIEHCNKLLEELHQAKLQAHREHRT